MPNLRLRPSRQLLAGIIFSHLLALVVVWFSALPWFVCVVLDGLVMLSLRQQLNHHWFVGERHLSVQDGRWVLASAGAETLLELSGEYYLSLWLMVLVFRDENRRRRVIVLLPDSAGQDQLRRLRVFLKTIPQSV